jgi:hypothetical protein
MLQTLRAPPRPGSLQESVLILLLMKQETIEHARFRALSQLLISKKEGVEAFEEYMKIAFPYLAASKQKKHAEAIKVLEAEIRRGAFSIRPQHQPQIRSRMQGRILARSKPQSPKEADSLYRKLGSMTDQLTRNRR